MIHVFIPTLPLDQFGGQKKVMIHGVVRSNRRGVPKCIFQKEATEKAEKEKSRGTLKVDLMKIDSKVQGLLALSYYYSKSLYMMDNAIDKVQWIKKKRRVFRKYLQRTSEITFHRINVIDVYNYNMNNVDVADRLRGSYRFDHCMCK